MSRRPIVSPTGRRYTIRQYLTRYESLRPQGGTTDCAEGHLHCALWRGGPCAVALYPQLEVRLSRAGPS